MALILTLGEGQAFRVGDERVVVTRILGPRNFVLERADGELFEVVDDRSAQVLPEVRVSAGDRGERGQARLVIEAPRDIRIQRERRRR